MSDKETFEGDINRIKAWVHFIDGSDVDEDTQLLVNDVKLLFDMIAERDARIAELLEDNVKADDTIEIYFNKSKALESEVEQLESKLELAVEGLRFYADDAKWESQQYPSYGRRLATIHDKDVGEVIAKTGHRWSIGGKTARETLKQIGETD